MRGFYIYIYKEAIMNHNIGPVIHQLGLDEIVSYKTLS